VRSKSFSLVSEVLAGAESETIGRRGVEMTQRNQHGFRLASMLGFKRAMLCALILDCLPVALFSQSLQYPLQDNAGLRLPTTPDSVVVDRGDPRPRPGEKKVCSIQPFPGMSSTASVTSLQIPSKAQKEYEHACTALKNKKMPEAEQHLRKATEIYPEYLAGWVMLGQTLETRQQTAEARDACSRASSADPNYLPAYLCLAEIAGREQAWNEVLSLTNRALELDAVNDAYAYFFSAIAYFNLNRLREAEQRALKAEAIDREHYEPLLQLLLAQIYRAKNNSAEAASHLQEYLKLSPESQYSDDLKKDFAEAHNSK
jgi:predicted Zn-dependent protease